MTFQPSPSNDQGGINISGEIRQGWASDGPEYSNPNPKARILGGANETEIEIDGQVSEALIDSGAMISMMSKGYWEEQGCDTVFRSVVPIEGSGAADVPYLGYVEVRM